MKNELNEKLVIALGKYYPKTKDLAHFLMDVLDLSRESVYRRLRSEVSFSFDEICKIACLMEISIDRLVGLGKTDKAFFDQRVSKSSDPTEIFREIMSTNTDMLNHINKTGQDARAIFVLNRIPLSFILAYPGLTKFFYYKWTYHVHKGEMNAGFDEFVIPEEIQVICRRYKDECEWLTGDMTMIIDEKIFLYTIREINYFYKRRLLDRDHIVQMQEELQTLADNFEMLARRGVNNYGAKVLIYLSEVDIEPNHSYIEYDGVVSVHYWTPSAELLTSYNAELCKRQLEWIESLKRYTILITQCNELQQIAFFNAQKEYLKEMVDNTAEHHMLDTVKNSADLKGEIGKWC
ncbi:MAG: hypothetical protein E6767_02125 [Dysgonomonas sp.]|nr:hypothetical protein [Dysgonomonas sp.]